MKDFLLKNIYKFNLFLDRHEVFKFFLLISGVSVPMIFLSFGYIMTFLLLFTAVCAFTLTRVFTINRSKRSLYDVPENGDILVFIKSFNLPNYGYGWQIRAGTEWVISNVTEWDSDTGDWELCIRPLISNNLDMTSEINIKYFKSRGYWKKKVDIRNDKLKKLGI